MDGRIKWVIGALILVAGLGWALAPARRRGLRAAPPPSERHYREGLARARAGNGAGAVGEWTLAIAMNPEDERPYDALAAYYLESGQPAPAAATLQRLARAIPTAAHLDCRFAQAAFAAGWVSQAGEAAERAVRAEPACPLAHTMRGIVLDDAGDPAAALTELAKAHQLDPADERMELTLAQAEGRSGHRAAALQHAREVLQRDPASAQAEYLMGWLEARVAPHSPATAAVAIRYLRQALEQSAQYWQAQAELGALYARQGRFRPALPLLEAARRQNPTDAGIARDLATVYAALGDARAARLAALAQRLEGRQQRRRVLRRLHLAHPADSVTTLRLARLELAQGQTQEAGDLAQQVLRANPDNRGALDLEQQLFNPPASSPP